MYDQITVAVAGTGFIGPVHVEALKRLGVKVKGILGSSPEKSETARKKLALEKAYDSFESLLRDEEIQAVHLAIPNILHYEYAKQALMAGKHVMCEKPLAMNATEGSELVRLAKSSGLAAGVTYNIRYYPLNMEARQRIREGQIGRIYSIVGSYVQDWLLLDTDYNWRVLADQGGALRAVADIGTHWMDLVSSMSGLELEAVFADLRTVHPVRKRPKGEMETFSGKQLLHQDLEEVPITTEDCGNILFRFKGGAMGNLWVSQVSSGWKNCLRYEISGAKQSLAWNSEKPNELWIGHRSRANEVMLKDAAIQGSLASAFINYPGGHNEGFPDTFKQCFRAFYDDILQNTPAQQVLYPTFEEAQKELQICEAILESHRTEKWVLI